MPFTTYLLLQLGTTVFASVYTVAQAVLGSLLLMGNVYFDTSIKANPSQYVNSGAALTFGTSGHVAGGGMKLSASGSRNLTALIQVPSSYSSGAVLEYLSLEANKQPLTTSGSFVMNCPTAKSSIASCTAIRHQIRFGTGTLEAVNTGALLHTKAIAGTYYGIITNASGGAAIFGGAGPNTSANDIVFKAKLHEKYGR